MISARSKFAIRIIAFLRFAKNTHGLTGVKLELDGCFEASVRFRYKNMHNMPRPMQILAICTSPSKTRAEWPIKLDKRTVTRLVCHSVCVLLGKMQIGLSSRR